MLKPLSHLLSTVVRDGNLTCIDSEGAEHRFGNGEGPLVAIRLTDRRFERHLALDPEMAAGEGYMEGRLRIERGTVYDFIALVMRNLADRPFPSYAQHLAGLRNWLRFVSQFNPSTRSRRNVHHHYDIDPRIYDLFLDPDRQYSCAYFTAPGMSLAEAQAAKKRHIAAKLNLQPGQKVLDIGCGWGGLALYLARAGDVDVTGITLSDEQLKIAEKRAHDADDLSHKPQFVIRDYREMTGVFDRIVSVGMFEHVGIPHYRTFFSTVARLLAPGGTALLHTIGRTDRPAATNPFISRYIFPGGYIPALSEIMAAVEASGLIVSDVEVLRLHYAETLRAWRHRFLANRPAAVAIAGEEFCRMWEFYLAGSEAAFRFENFVVFQVQLTRRINALPITRNYMGEAEGALPLGLVDSERPRGVAAGR
ncbi:cyclopropane-fatty-acyl-phospholipid synthase family protein [Hyphomicrobium sp.]|uniref:cyclopropane-fatty-acyl-phospholipid synthase family protein n=1 Tax=Hyphomicrobium sp. TaxID=82 RepID=UPI002E3605C6|nr:cyclopropane-fatty-acyl-phospholipid synthase family protein [Hyphomicrobium sp.]HEX2843073.1 cyclopropane-fatty-acyl-phospholipid synthase family protein [Hyphomicrobium sp.]